MSMTLALAVAQLRIAHVLKNLLVFVPVITSHQFLEADAWLSASIAALSFALIAMAGYQVNDLLDRTSDSLHETRRRRPYAAGQVRAGIVVATAIALCAAGFGLAALYVPRIVPVLVTYAALATAYSAFLKKIIAIDIVLLSAFHVLRIAAGAAAIQVELSNWLLAFSFFLFLSLALVKRFCEIPGQPAESVSAVNWTYDERAQTPLLVTSVCAGMAALLLFSFYIQDDAVRTQNAAPDLLWVGVAILFLLLLLMWRRAMYGRTNQNIYMRLIADPSNWVLGAGLIAVFIVAAVWSP